jgi:hypothetical protein
VAKDKQTAKAVFVRMGDDYDSAIWHDNFNFARWRRWSEETTLSERFARFFGLNRSS